jgi:hypothetical protein
VVFIFNLEMILVIFRDKQLMLLLHVVKESDTFY